MPRGQVISFLKVCKMIAKGFVYHVVSVKDLECETPSIEEVPVMMEFPLVFPNELPGVPPKWEIDFGINLLSDTYPIYSPPYRTAPPKMKKLKLKLKELVEKSFIQPNISPYDAPVLLVKNNDM